MLEKWKATVVSILMSLTMISVGFSSWSLISVFEGETLTGEIRADQIVKTDEYLSFDTAKGKDNSGIEIFDYASTGFIWYEYIGTNENNETTFASANKELTFSSTTARIILYFKLASSETVDYTALGETMGVDIDVSVAGGFFQYTDVSKSSISVAQGVTNETYGEPVTFSNGTEKNYITKSTDGNGVSLAFELDTPSADMYLAVVISLSINNVTEATNILSAEKPTFFFNTSLKSAE